MEKHSINVMRISLAIVYVWFGALKIFGISPAGELVEQTVYWFRPEIFIPILGICEVLIGLGLLIKKFIPYTILLLLLHMTVTLFPIFILKTICFNSFPFCPTLIGQYIIKNLVLISGALVVSGKYNEKYYIEMNLRLSEE
ncbi:DoxX family membrane protein [Flavobacterium sp. ZS1P70]|uniref:DoxX family membrane protein n=1 Tax=Flavobacterium zhoui TaxID=3230414 RepID=A0ABW6I4X3_9FLAO